MPKKRKASIGDRLWIEANVALGIDILAAKLELDVNVVRKIVNEVPSRPQKTAQTKTSGGRNISVMTEALSQLGDETRASSRSNPDCTTTIKNE